MLIFNTYVELHPSAYCSAEFSMAFSTLRLREPARLQVFSRNYRARLVTPQLRYYADDALSAEISAKDSVSCVFTHFGNHDRSPG